VNRLFADGHSQPLDFFVRELVLDSSLNVRIGSWPLWLGGNSQVGHRRTNRGHRKKTRNVDNMAEASFRTARLTTASFMPRKRFCSSA
jgi:hypothetical protein